MRKAFIASAVLTVGVLGYGGKDDAENPITIFNPTQFTATLNNTGSSGTGSSVLSYTVTYSVITPTAISLDPATTSTSTTMDLSNYSNSILLAGSFPSTTTSPGSGTSTIPGSGTGTGTSIISASPVSGTITLTQSRADSLSGGLYRIHIRSTSYPDGEIGHGSSPLNELSYLT